MYRLLRLLSLPIFPLIFFWSCFCLLTRQWLRVMLRLEVLLYDHILLLRHIKIKIMPMLMPLLRLEPESEYEQEHAAND